MNQADTITNRQLFDFMIEFKEEMTEFKKETNKRFDRIEDTQHQHTKILSDHSRTLSDHSRTLSDHSRTLKEHSKMLHDYSSVLHEHSKHLFELLKRGDTLKVKISGTMILINALVAIFCATIISLLI
jgi:SMC interacting uncharacterized protein involved in chromosome segregation